MQAGIEIRCPKCYSAHVAVFKNGAAPSVTDHISLLEGSVDNTDLILQCGQCGTVFSPSEARMGQHSAFGSGVQQTAGKAIQPEEEQVRNICRSEGAISAVKFVRDTYGWSLKESKDFVDRLMEHTAPAQYATAYTPAPAIDEAEIIRIVQEQGKLNAVKYCKDHYNLGLKEALMYVDDFIKTKGITPAGGKTGCFIATACYGDYDAPEVKILRQYRDQVLNKTYSGRLFIRLYYYCSPNLATAISKSDRARAFVRTHILNGLVQRIAKKR